MTDQKEFSELLAENRGLVYSVIAPYCRDQVAQDDLYQDVSMKAWLAFKTFKGESKFSSWLGKIARNTAIDHWRRIKNLKTVLISNFLWDISDTEYIEEQPGKCLSVLERLSPTERRTVLMRMEGMTFAQISEATGEPMPRLLTRMHRIKKLLSKSITKNGTLKNITSYRKWV